MVRTRRPFQRIEFRLMGIEKIEEESEWLERSIAEDRRAPREAAAHAFDQHVLATLDTPVAHGDIER
ncbi:hypothetical protein YK56LOC_51440 [Caballeronia sp. HLA56]